MQYKRWMSIFRIYRREIRVPFILLLIAMPLLQLISLFQQLNGAEYTCRVEQYRLMGYYYNDYGFVEEVEVLWSRRLEVLMADAGMDKIFLGALVILIGLLVMMPIRQGKAESFYFAVNRLAVHRSAPFVMEMLHVVYCLVLLLAVQLGTVLAGAAMYAYMVPEEVQRTQALFMAFMEWDFLRILFPIYDMRMLFCNVIVVFGAAVCVTAAARGIQYGWKNYLSALFFVVMVGRAIWSATSAPLMYGVMAILSIFISAYQIWVLFDKIIPGREAGVNEEE